MRILALNWRCARHPQAGGAELNLFEQARRWIAKGHEVAVVCADPGRRFAPQRDELVDGVRVRRRGGQWTVYPRAALYMLRAGRRYDRVLDVSNGVPFFAPLFTRRPVTLLVHHVHKDQWRVELPGPAAAFGRFLEERVVPVVYKRSRVVAVSPTTRDALVATGFSERQIVIAYNGIAAPRQIAADAPGRRVLYLGRLKRYKRIELLIAAFADLCAGHPDVTLEIAGDGDARPTLEQRASELGIADRVHFHGFVDDDTKARLLAEATVFATPSMHEGWGVSVIEANAYGCPCVAYDVPGLNVAICDGETGLLAADDDEFRGHLARLLDDASLRARMSDAARRWAARFGWEACAETTLEAMA